MNRPRLYIDEDATGRSLVNALRARHVDVVTALEVEMVNKSDEAHLRWATQAGRALYSFNIADYLQLHQRFWKTMRSTGVLCSPFNSDCR